MLSANRSKSFVAPSPTHEHIEFETEIGTIDESSEMTNSPSDSSTSTLKIKIPPRVQFHHAEGLRRQQSLPSADSDCSFSEGMPEWPTMDDAHPHTINIDGEDVELRRKSSQLPPQKPHEPNIDFELDVKVLINSGKCVLHTKEVNGEEKGEFAKNFGFKISQKLFVKFHQIQVFQKKLIL